MTDYGDHVVGDIIYMMDTTRVNYVPTNLTDAAVSIYKNDGIAESTAGITLTTNFDNMAGLWCLKIDTSQDGSFYSAANSFRAVLTAGTLAGATKIGTILGSFSLAAAETFLIQKHFRFRTDAEVVDAVPSWGADQDVSL